MTNSQIKDLMTTIDKNGVSTSTLVLSVQTAELICRDSDALNFHPFGTIGVFKASC